MLSGSFGRVNPGIYYITRLTHISEYIQHIGNIFDLPLSVFNFLAIEDKKIEQQQKQMYQESKQEMKSPRNYKSVGELLKHKLF